MKLVLGLCAVLVAASSRANEINDAFRFVEKKLGIDLAGYPDAKAELTEHVAACGTGVVRGMPGKNRCRYAIEIDEWFLKSMDEKTGYLHDDDWAHREGVQFITASREAMENVPEAWDLSDIGPMTDIHRQQCSDCWSTSSRKLLEQALATHGVRDADGELIKLSAQTTLSRCCTWCGSCRGGNMRTPDFFKTEGDRAFNYGLPTRELDPYLGRNSRCRFSDDELSEFTPKLLRAPYVGSSLDHSRFFRPDERNGPKVENTMALMMEYKSNALVTISAISSNGGIITRCSNINSGGNHMQNIVGWYKSDNMTIARVQNSWGTGHGQDGYTHIRWECGQGRFNRGLGRSTRVGIFATESVCGTVADAHTGSDKRFVKGEGGGVIIGRPGRVDQSCSWLPQAGIMETLSSDGCQVRVNPDVTTEYHVIATDRACGTTVSSMVLVTPTAGDGREVSRAILTPHGMTRH